MGPTPTQVVELLNLRQKYRDDIKSYSRENSGLLAIGFAIWPVGLWAIYRIFTVPDRIKAEFIAESIKVYPGFKFHENDDDYGY